jgi:hypothetical protein
MLKFLLNLLVQISKAFVYSKIQNFIQKYFPSAFGPSGLSAQPWPILFFPTGQFSLPSPLGLGLPAGPARHHGPTGHWSSSSSRTEAKHGAAAGRPRAASTVAPTPPPEEKNDRI